MAKGKDQRDKPLEAPHGLAPRALLFCLEYLANGLNGAAAARAAGYSPHSAECQASRLLRNAKVKAYLAPRLDRRVKKLELKADRLDEELAACCFARVTDAFHEDGSLKAADELPDELQRAMVKVKTTELFEGKDRKHVGYLREVAIGDKVGAITAANRVLGRLKDKLDVTTRMSHEQLVLLAQKLREKKLAAARGGAAVGRAPGAPAGGPR
jgi:phage terminase small subunit